MPGQKGRDRKNTEWWTEARFDVIACIAAKRQELITRKLSTTTAQIAAQTLALGEQSLTLYDNWLPQAQADELLSLLPTALPWRQERIRLYGREMAIPRLQCWLGDAGTRYHYSGLILEPEPWPACLLVVRRQLEAQLGRDFNSVLCNWYRDGRDSMGWHSDDEPELGPAPVVASLTLGEARRFQFRRRGQTRLDTSLELHHNSLLVMHAHVQSHWQHQVPKMAPKSRKSLGPRINLTFRQIDTA